MSSIQKIARADLKGFELKASLCDEPWEKMSGNDRLRWCESCQHFVYNAQILSEEEFLSLVWFQEGIRPSVIYRRQDGKLLVKRCRGSRSKQIVNLALPAACSIIVLSLVLSLAGGSQSSASSCAAAQTAGTAVVPSTAPPVESHKSAQLPATSSPSSVSTTSSFNSMYRSAPFPQMPQIPVPPSNPQTAVAGAENGGNSLNSAAGPQSSHSAELAGQSRQQQSQSASSQNVPPAEQVLDQKQSVTANLPAQAEGNEPVGAAQPTAENEKPTASPRYVWDARLNR